MGNGEWGMGSGEWGMGNGEWGRENIKLASWMTVLIKQIEDLTL